MITLDDRRGLIAAVLERLAREQRHAEAGHAGCRRDPTECAENIARSLATTRMEAAREAWELIDMHPLGAARNAAADQWGTLAGSAPIASDTLDEWARAHRAACEEAS